jgi:hypothetical protein
VPFLFFYALTNGFPDIVGQLESKISVEELIRESGIDVNHDTSLVWFRMIPQGSDIKDDENNRRTGNWNDAINELRDSTDTHIRIKRNVP